MYSILGTGDILVRMFFFAKFVPLVTTVYNFSVRFLCVSGRMGRDLSLVPSPLGGQGPDKGILASSQVPLGRNLIGSFEKANALRFVCR